MTTSISRNTRPRVPSHVLSTTSLTRRGALKLLLAGTTTSIASLAMPSLSALGDVAQTEAQIAEAQAKLNETQAQLDAIATEYEALAAKQSETLGEIEETQKLIEQTSSEIEAKQAEIEDKQDRLGKRVSSAYKAGPTGWLEILFSATSFEDLVSGVHYLDRITQSERMLIDGVRAAKEDLARKQEALENQKADLEALSETQKEQLGEMQANQARVQEIIDGLDEDVRALMAQRDAELEAARQEAERAAREREAAAAAAASAASSSTSSSSSSSSGTAASSEVTGSIQNHSVSGSAASVVASCYSTPSPGLGLCAGWVTNVFSNAGFGWIGGNANDQYNSWCVSSDRSYLQPGMIIAVSSHPHTSAGRIYGHVGIYVGDGTVMDNVGYIRSCSVDYWIDFYGQTVVPRWGWFGGIALS